DRRGANRCGAHAAGAQRRARGLGVPTRSRPARDKDANGVSERADTPERLGEEPAGRVARVLDWVERTGNRLPDPALLFFLLLLVVWGLSAFMAQLSYEHIDPRTNAPIEVVNLLTPVSLAEFMSNMVTTF